MLSVAAAGRRQGQRGPPLPRGILVWPHSSTTPRRQLPPRHYRRPQGDWEPSAGLALSHPRHHRSPPLTLPLLHRQGERIGRLHPQSLEGWLARYVLPSLPLQLLALKSSRPRDLPSCSSSRSSHGRRGVQAAAAAAMYPRTKGPPPLPKPPCPLRGEAPSFLFLLRRLGPCPCLYLRCQCRPPDLSRPAMPACPPFCSSRRPHSSSARILLCQGRWGSLHLTSRFPSGPRRPAQLLLPAGLRGGAAGRQRPQLRGSLPPLPCSQAAPVPRRHGGRAGESTVVMAQWRQRGCRGLPEPEGCSLRQPAAAVIPHPLPLRLGARRDLLGLRDGFSFNPEPCGCLWQSLQVGRRQPEAGYRTA